MPIKVHIILSVLFLSALLFGLQYASDLKSAEIERQKAEATEAPFIQIVSATWGANCNALLQRFETPGTKTQTKLVARDNALRAISKLCNGKESCAFQVTPQNLGASPAPRCRKLLDMRYRCYMTDRAVSTQNKDNDTVSIDCLRNAS